MSKVVLITGASSGIGLSIANYLQEKGMTVYGTSRTERKANDFKFKMLPLEVSDTDSINNAIQKILDEQGRIDILINNAGKGVTGPIEETPTEEMRKVFDINFFGVIDLMKAVLPIMRKQQSGMIINITSIAGYMGLPFRGIYSATKGATELATEAVSMEAKKFGVKVVNIAPGDFATNIASGRYHSPVIEGSAYEKAYRKNLDVMDEHVDHGRDPKILAKKVFQIINTKKPKGHYTVGSFMERISIFLKLILPDRMYERMLMNYYDL